jgi:Cu/Ag efflux pump CusA
VLFYDLALVIAGGLLFGTLLTLVVIPCLYAMIYRDRLPDGSSQGATAAP